MERCEIDFIARRWWRRLEVWVIASLLVTGSFALGFGASQWSLASWYSAQVAEVRRGYDEATVQREMRLRTSWSRPRPMQQGRLRTQPARPPERQRQPAR